MSFDKLSKDIVSAIIAVFMMVAFIPVFQQLGINVGWITLFIVAVVVAIIFTIVGAFKDFLDR